MGVPDIVDNVFEALNLLSPLPVEPFPSAYPLTFDTSNASFNSCENTTSGDPTTKDMCGAVVDLTGNPANPVYAGHNDSLMLYVGSMAKLFAMYVAFELKLRVEMQAKKMIAQKLVSTSTSGWEKNVFDALKKAWKPKLDGMFPSLPSGMPDFANIVSLSTAGDASFQTKLTANQIDTVKDGTPQGSFGDWMKSMMRWSNNNAAAKCISAISYPYINGVLGSAGFFTSGNGLWVSGNYGGNDWLGGPGNKAGQNLDPHFATAQGRAKSNFTGTALQVARLLTLMAQGRLVDSSASSDMIDTMSNGILDPSTGQSGDNCFIKMMLDAATPPRPYKSFHTKIGIGKGDGFRHDSGILEVDRGASPTLRFIEVILGSPPANTAGFFTLTVGYYDCLVAQHP
jgi:hypothetical protein